MSGRRRAGRASTRQRAGFVGLGLLLGVGLLEIGLRLGGLVLERGQDARNRAALHRGGDVRVLCIGESTTALGGATSYPRLLEQHLNAMSAGPVFRVINGGRAATVTDRILERLGPMLDRYEPDIVVAMMGINDRRPERHVWTPLVRALSNLRVARLCALLADHLRHRLAGEGGRGARRDLSAVTAAIGRDDLGAARDLLLAALRAAPGDLVLHHMLSTVERKRGDPRPADIHTTEARIRAWLDADPGRLDLQFALLGAYRAQESVGRAVELVEAARLGERAAGRDQKIAVAETYARAARWAARTGRTDRAVAYLGAALQGLPDGSVERRVELLVRLARLERRRGDPASAARHEAEARRLRERLDDSGTAANYRALAAVLAERGVRLVAAQYPLRKVEDLERMLGHDEAVVFVDNRGIFAEALRSAPYYDLFSDEFAGDFGHLKRRGRDLLAANVARAILESLPPRRPEADSAPRRSSGRGTRTAAGPPPDAPRPGEDLR